MDENKQIDILRRHNKLVFFIFPDKNNIRKFGRNLKALYFFSKTNL